MLTMRSRVVTVLVWFRPVVPRHFPSCCIRDESEWIGMSVIPLFIPNAHEWPRLHLPHLKYVPDAAKVELRFTEATPIIHHDQPESFKRFKAVIACREGSRITKILLELLQYYYDSRRCIYGAGTNFIPMHHDMINRE